MLSAGIAHLTYLKGEFHAQVPNWLPLDKDLVVVLSGWVEISFGAALLFIPRCKVWRTLWGHSVNLCINWVCDESASLSLA